MIGDGHGKRPWVYYSSSKGLMRSIHRYSGMLLLTVFLVTPWIYIGGLPLFRADLAGRRLYLAGHLFTALDTRFLLMLLLLSAIGLGLFTAIVGRVWCGYACPQTVFLEEIIRRIETWIEGDRGARRKLDESPWTAGKIARKASKWSLFAIVSVVISLMTMSYLYAPTDVWTGAIPRGAYLFAAALAGLLYFDLAWFREQFCNYLCPYARIQSVLADANTWTVGYDPRRGEPRLGTPGVQKATVFSTGACVDCNRCVAVCPQGIDIRNGFQLECITCGHCIDACTDVMKKRNFPSLIQYTTENRLTANVQKPSRVRPALYASVIGGLLLFTAVLLFQRDTFDARVSRMRGVDPELLADGRVRNTFDGHIWNNSPQDRTFAITTLELGTTEVVTPYSPLVVPAGQDLSFPIVVNADADALTSRSTHFQFEISVVGSEQPEEISRNATFVAPRGHN
jgi:cytochrome c oxidase accessory protein FixG